MHEKVVEPLASLAIYSALGTRSNLASRFSNIHIRIALLRNVFSLLFKRSAWKMPDHLQKENAPMFRATYYIHSYYSSASPRHKGNACPMAMLHNAAL